MNVLVTGGAGYIGSHTVQELLRSKHHVVVYDNFLRGHAEAIPKDVPAVGASIHNKDLLAMTMRAFQIDAVVHFAAESIVSESMIQPSSCYHTNVAGTLALLDVMKACGVCKIVFSSTAAVYGDPAVWPITEDMALAPTNVYGQTKWVVERMLADFSRAYRHKYVSLRYFNAAGASKDGSIGEDHRQETHLIPLVLQTALGDREFIEIFGADYPTPDGTCIRDYIHVDDLARAHVLALDHLEAGGSSRAYNLGSESGFSVREIVRKAKQITKVDFDVHESPRRAGDPAVLIASSTRIKDELGWKPLCSDLNTIITTAWRWHKNHPNGFGQKQEVSQLRASS